MESLFENLAMGATVDEFLEWFPDLEPKLVYSVLEFARASLRELDEQNVRPDCVLCFARRD